ncbi:hypothetical protein HDU97_001711 [Phlyctochytrium planicorne]|nr:hypothetical protein HDU97_001711 [Phlyctochytrium planicorne]
MGLKRKQPEKKLPVTNQAFIPSSCSAKLEGVLPFEVIHQVFWCLFEVLKRQDPVDGGFSHSLQVQSTEQKV